MKEKNAFRRKGLVLIYILTLTILSVSCSNDNIEDVIHRNCKEAKSLKVFMKDSFLDDNTFNNVNKSLYSLFNDTRGTDSDGNLSPKTDITIEDAKSVLSPLVPSGKILRDNILDEAAKKEFNVTDEEIERLKNMDDAQLAELAYYNNVMVRLQETTGTIPNDCESNQAYYAKYSKQDILDCLTFAIGLDTASYLYGYISETAALISAKTAIKIGLAVVGRTLGWVGVAYSMYQFGDCLSKKK